MLPFSEAWIKAVFFIVGSIFWVKKRNKRGIAIFTLAVSCTDSSMIMLHKDQIDDDLFTFHFFLQFVPQVWSRYGCFRSNTSCKLPSDPALRRMGPNLLEVLLVQPEGRCCPGTWANQCHKLGPRRGATDNNKLQTEVNRRTLCRLPYDLDCWVCYFRCLLLLGIGCDYIILFHMPSAPWMLTSQ